MPEVPCGVVEGVQGTWCSGYSLCKGCIDQGVQGVHEGLRCVQSKVKAHGGMDISCARGV